MGAENLELFEVEEAPAIELTLHLPRGMGPVARRAAPLLSARNAPALVRTQGRKAKFVPPPSIAVAVYFYVYFAFFCFFRPLPRVVL